MLPMSVPFAVSMRWFQSLLAGDQDPLHHGAQLQYRGPQEEWAASLSGGGHSAGSAVQVQAAPLRQTLILVSALVLSSNSATGL